MSPLAAELLAVAGIASVLIAGDTVSLDAEYAVDWAALGIGHVIRKHVRTGVPIVAASYFENLPAEAVNNVAVSPNYNVDHTVFCTTPLST